MHLPMLPSCYEPNQVERSFRRSFTEVTLMCRKIELDFLRRKLSHFARFFRRRFVRKVARAKGFRETVLNGSERAFV